MSQVNELVAFLLANPLFLVPILFAAAMILFAVVKKLLKLAAIGAIATALYILLVEYFGAGV